MEVDALFKRLKEKIVDEKYKVKDIVEEFIDQINKKIEKKKLKARTMISGSYARGTWIFGESDVDIYVIFDSEEDIGKLKYLVPKNFKIEKGTRDYFWGYFKGIKFEVVPLVKINSLDQVKNSIDLSVFHNEYVINNIAGLEKDVYLFKKFLKGAGVYGAESYIRGFSGYACEVLIIRYKGIENLFKDIANWKYKVYLDKDDRFSQDAIVLLDPTNKNRNILASVSKQSLDRLIYYVKLFLINPKEEFFEENYFERVIGEIKARKSKYLLKNLRIKEPKQVFLSKLRRKLDNFNNYFSELKTYSYLIFDKDLAIIIIEFLNDSYEIVEGPSVYLEILSIKSFIKKHKTFFLWNAKICTIKKKLNYRQRKSIVNRLIRSIFKTVFK
ncbi:MAG: nucleotidyltransferase domain-containing protein [Candidatus Parvarchaeota archaeon]|nr:nucleotidyltransferase domain-containing protein [Candidatus Rehaiarchaeum fermentans]